MFDPNKTITDLINSAYLDGSAFAFTVFSSNPTPDDSEWRERMRDAHCDGMLRALGKVPHFNLDSIGPGVLASGFSGFEDSWRHMETPLEDMQALSEAGNDIVASMEQDRSINTAMFVSPDERWPAPQFDGTNPEQEGLAVEFAMRRCAIPYRLLGSWKWRRPSTKQRPDPAGVNLQGCLFGRSFRLARVRATLQPV